MNAMPMKAAELKLTPRHPTTMDGRDPSVLRGDPITGDRYWSKEFAQKEWDHMWTRIWHVAGRTAELREPGDYIVHDFMHESVFCVKQSDGSIKAFYNTCGHRGQRLGFLLPAGSARDLGTGLDDAGVRDRRRSSPGLREHEWCPAEHPVGTDRAACCCSARPTSPRSSSVPTTVKAR